MRGKEAFRCRSRKSSNLINSLFHRLRFSDTCWQATRLLIFGFVPLIKPKPMQRGAGLFPGNQPPLHRAQLPG